MTDFETDKIIERIERMVEVLSGRTGIEFTFGYVGNCSGIPGTSAYVDDRLWYVFAPHSGRVGKLHDRIGGHSTSELHTLLVELGGALDLAAVLAVPR